MLNILAAILLFGFVIMFHELGHFLLAKANGVEVTEFSIGMGPRLVSRVWRGTRYSLKILPLGGSCAMADEDTESGNPNGFLSKSVWARISIIAAGPIFNFILAFFFGIIIVAYRGYDLPVITNIVEGYPAEAAGLKAGDLILSVNGRRMLEYQDLSMYLQLHPEEELEIVYGRLPEGQAEDPSAWYQKNLSYETGTTTLRTIYNEETQSYMMGIEHYSNYHPVEGLGKLLRLGWHQVALQGQAAIESFRLLFRGYVGADDVGGPVRIVAGIGQMVEEIRPEGWFIVLLNLINWGMFLSASLGAVNLIPLPALDGGRLAFLLVEAVRGKAIDQEKEGMVHFAGMMVLLALMIVIMFNDIRNLIF